MKSNAYWINRVNEVLADNHQSSTEQILRINNAYEKAAKDLQKDIDKIFIKYATGHNMTLADAKRALNGKIPNNVDELRLRLAQTSNEELKKSILAELNKNAYKARITRLEALKQSLSVNYKLLADKEFKLSKKSYIRTIKEAYYRTCYNFQSGINLAFDVANINTRAVNKILNTEWFGRNYSDSVWNNTQVLANKLDETITSGFLSGKSLKDIAKNIAELSSFGMFAAERLVRSETTFFNNQAALQGYKEVGIEKYVYVATLDARTCSCGKHGRPSCGSLDRKVFEIAKQEPSVNCPPMHAFCRCTVRSYINDEILDRCKRRARDPETGKTYLVDNMSYEDWYNKYVKGNPKAELAVKKERNIYADKNQYEKYKSVLGKEAPKSIEAFQELKYTDSKKWELFKDYTKSRSTNMISSFTSFEDYQSMKSSIDNSIIGLVTSNGIRIIGQSKHFIERVFGTTKDPKTDLPRSGVELVDIKDALLKGSIRTRASDPNSIKFITDKCIVSINPHTGNLIQVNPQ